MARKARETEVYEQGRRSRDEAAGWQRSGTGSREETQAIKCLSNQVNTST